MVGTNVERRNCGKIDRVSTQGIITFQSPEQPVGTRFIASAINNVASAIHTVASTIHTTASANIELQFETKRNRRQSVATKYTNPVPV